MGLINILFKAVESVVQHRGFEIVDRRKLYEWQMLEPIVPAFRSTCLPDDTEHYLLPDNPKLLELKERYSQFNNDVTTPLAWTETHVSPQEMQHFRGENAYVWQIRGLNMNPLAYALTTYYIKAIDHLGLLDRMSEDDLFGCIGFVVDNRKVSRDLLDSIIEIYFLERHLGISKKTGLQVLDIGAGYGRLAHRMTSALPNVSRYVCTDGYPISTFICECYLRSRRLLNRAEVVPLDKIEHTLADSQIDIAINIHSFSECQLSAIDWWISLLAKNRVRNLMIVPNSRALATNDGADFGHLLEKNGYRCIAQEPKFLDPVVQKYGINPTQHFLFELQ